MEKKEVLKKYFGYDSFRMIQEKCIDSILDGNDTVCIMSTGGGKSITFQVPALMLDGLCIVISPLISLMTDQVLNLKKKNIVAKTINSSLSTNEKNKIYDELKNNKIKFLYISPEMLQNHFLIRILKSIKIALFVVDEAHCISMWGHDFRLSYQFIPGFLADLSQRPAIALFTATANNKVIQDMNSILNIHPNIFKSSFDRPNLVYNVLNVSDKDKYILEFIKTHDEYIIIYTLTQKRAEGIFQMLIDKGYKASLYHGGLDKNIKEAYSTEYVSGLTKIMVATNAFGMGIDIPNIRYIINYDLPMSVEDLCQQQGRASRDGEEGYCYLLYDRGDIKQNEFFINTTELNSTLNNNEIRRIKRNKREMLLDVIGYATTKRCLHEYMLSYFGELYMGYCGKCSNCKK